MPQETSHHRLIRRAQAPLIAGCVASLFVACATGRVDSQTDGETGMDASSNVPPAMDGGTPTDAPDSWSAPAAEAGGGVDALEETAVVDSAPPPVDSPSDAPPDATTGTSCTPLPSTDTLPFAVDLAGKFVPSGYEGDYMAVTMPLDPTCGGNRSSASAMGNCHPVTYKPLAAGPGVAGWAGVLWQHPANNWGTAAGYAIPTGATKVSFWARGDLGGEVATFIVGFAVTPTPTSPCVDTVSGSLRQTLTTTWTHYTIPFAGQYGVGVISPFGYVIGAADQPARDAGAADAGLPSTLFYIDDIQWQ
jgi:hypothetical protein